jgi:hypothetical protein
MLMMIVTIARTSTISSKTTQSAMMNAETAGPPSELESLLAVNVADVVVVADEVGSPVSVVVIVVVKVPRVDKSVVSTKDDEDVVDCDKVLSVMDVVDIVVEVGVLGAVDSWAVVGGSVEVESGVAVVTVVWVVELEAVVLAVVESVAIVPRVAVEASVGNVVLAGVVPTVVGLSCEDTVEEVAGDDIDVIIAI